MCRLLFVVNLLLSTTLHASPIYHHTDKYGRSVFSDQPSIENPNDIINIEIQNNYRWNKPKTKFKSTKIKKSTRPSRKRKTKVFSLAELQNRCRKARNRYHKFRGARTRSDWASYKSKLKNHAEKKNYWCHRALLRK